MDDQAKQVLASLKALAPSTDPDASNGAWLADFRYKTALLRAFGGAAQPLHAVSLGTAGGVSVRTYRPVAAETPILFHVHGGGGIAGSLDIHDPALRALAAATGWRVVAPAYRLAPEHPFPAQLDDCYAALVAVAADARDSRIVVSGDSIGATIATALTALARDRGGPAVAGQVLLYPNTDLRRDAAYPSRRSEDGNIIALADLERQIDLYVATRRDRNDPRASPLLARSLADLPPSFVATCENDPLRDEGEAYAARLRDAGVAITHHRFAGMIHAFLQMQGRIAATDTLLTGIRAWLQAL